MPRTVLVLLLVMAGISLLRALLPPHLDYQFIVWFALYLFVNGEFVWERLYSLVTSVFIHEGLVHLLFNGFWIATIGTLVQRTLNSRDFLILFLGSAVAGGVLFVALNWGVTAIAVGASGGVFGLLGAFGHIGVARPWEDRPTRWRKLAAFTAVMMALNIAYAMVGGVGGPESPSIAWEAHAGGFFAGLFLFPWLLRRNLQEKQKSRFHVVD
ncbi:rhomboid family intramembrane serine protease [Fodinicurvata halophila]|uniref:Rhomboid family intramembrane serine protease n=2 Tax=Fodinicurvata halophila TaxID=1419723 RepID=A0ABV8UNH9_9PROT